MKTNNEADASTMTRRKALSRLGGVAFMAYSIPALTTLSVAHASSGASNSSNASEASEASEASTASEASSSSGPSKSSGSSAGLDSCGAENLTDPDYVDCQADNGL